MKKSVKNKFNFKNEKEKVTKTAIQVILRRRSHCNNSINSVKNQMDAVVIHYKQLFYVFAEIERSQIHKYFWNLNEEKYVIK